MHIQRVDQITQEIVDAFANLIPQLTSHCKPPEFDALNAIIKSENASIFIARNHSKKIVGTLTLIFFQIPTGKLARIDDVVVDKNHRGQGIAKALIKTALAEASEKKAAVVDLTSRPTRIAANQLYQKMGFKPRETNIYRYVL